MPSTPKLPSALRREAEQALFTENHQDGLSHRTGGFLFQGFKFHMCGSSDSLRRAFAVIISRFADAQVIADTQSPDITHFIVDDSCGSVDIGQIHRETAARSDFRVPHIVSLEWVEECWKEKTLLDEESTSFRIPVTPCCWTLTRSNRTSCCPASLK